MDHAYFRRFARRCRDLALSARNVAAKEQLYLWAEEFEARAAVAAGNHENLTMRVDETASAMTTDRSRGDGENAAR